MKVFIIGGVMIDMIVIIESDYIECMIMLNVDVFYLLFQEGVKMEVGDIFMYIGGGVVNVVVFLLCFGFDVLIILKFGCDYCVEIILVWLMDEGVLICWVFCDDWVFIGVFVLVFLYDCNVVVFMFCGVNMLFDLLDLKDEVFGVDFVYVFILFNQLVLCFLEIV